MKQSERLSQLMHILSERHNASTKYLAKALDVSESTVRRDIEFLASMKEEVRKVHGGVVLDGAKSGLEYMFELKLGLNVELKRRIARAAVGLLEDNDSVLLDSGTTCLYTAMELHGRKDLRMATADLQVAIELAKHDNIESLIIGGLIRPGYYTIGDTHATEMLEKFSIDKAIMGADAVDLGDGITNFSIFEVGVKRKILETARTRILVADYTKFGNSTFYKVGGISRFTTIITNQELHSRCQEAIREAGVNLVLA